MASGIFAGMEDFGLGEMSAQDIFRDKEAEEKKARAAAAAAAKEVKEEDFLFDKTYECPVCSKSFKEHTLRTGKARLVKTDMDLRPTFEGIEPLKYDVVQCTECGFTALTRYFVPMTVPQRKAILEKITARYRKPAERKDLYSYEDAVGRYKLALVNAIVKNAKASEKAYICLRAGWLARSYVEALEAEAAPNQTKIQEIKALENEFLLNAYEGFSGARQNESFPMCGMDESTLEYLLATLAIRAREFEVASRLISNLLVSPNVNSRTKDKVRDLKEELLRVKGL